MKKRLYLSSTKWGFFLLELPLIAWFVLALRANASATGALRYYPMLVAVGGIIVFVFLFFLRLVQCSYDEIRTVGRFSTRDRVILREGKTLTLTLRTHGYVGIDVYGHDGEVAALEWLRDSEPTDIRQLHTRAVGGAARLLRILAFYKIEGYDADALLHSAEPYRFSCEVAELTAETVNERRTVHARFLVTFDELGAVIPDSEGQEAPQA